MNKKTLKRMVTEPYCYISKDGETIQMEYGITPSGNAMLGRWVYRNNKGHIVDFNRYQHDLFEKYGFVVEN